MNTTSSFRFAALTLGLILLACSISLADAEPDRTLFGFTLGQGPVSLSITMSDQSVLKFTTAQAEFNPGIFNQGWWSTAVSNESTDDNYSVGTDHLDPGIVNNYFTFDLRGLRGAVVGATLSLPRGWGNQQIWGDGPHSLTYGLWDVSSDAAVLNDRINNPNVAIFNDLATGIQYGSYDLPTSGDPNDILRLALNAQALQDIQTAQGSFFSIGGTVTGPLPEPSSLLMMATGILGVAGVLRRQLS
jgi:hypothetical protein